MKTRILVVGLTAWALGLGLGALWFGRRPAPAAEPSVTAELAELRAQTRSLRADIAELRARPRGVEVAVDAARRPGSRQVSVGTVPRSTAAQTTAAAHAPADAVVHTELEYAEFLDGVLAGETIDDQSGQARGLMARVRAALAPGATVEDLVCGTSMCRVAMRHPDVSAYQAFQAAAIGSEPPVWKGPTTFVVPERGPDPDGPIEAVMYLGRGDALPSPEPPNDS